jgi:hypothetical protein
LTIALVLTPIALSVASTAVHPVVTAVADASATRPFFATSVAHAATCAISPTSNGTGLADLSAAGSLPSTTPRPGPDLLYRPAPRAPQLENTGYWTAPPILVSGTSAYRDGEYVYQDFLYDDTALAYPAETTPPSYDGNAADLVEVRLKPLASATAIRITYNTLLDPAVAAATVALGTSSPAHAMPHGAGASMPASVFVTVHGCAADVVSADTGATLPVVPVVAVDMQRRQVQVEVPYTVYDPRGKTSVRVGAAAGLWDTAHDRYLVPSKSKPAFFNVGFRFSEPLSGFRNSQQNAALGNGGDLSAFSASVDFTKLAANSNDDMVGTSTGVPASGSMDRIYASHFETRQGRGTYNPALQNALDPGYQPCEDPCSPEYAGQLQPYFVYVPAHPSPSSGWGITLYHHGCSENYNSFAARAARFADIDGGTIAVATEARSECIWELDQAGADLYEAWADAARHYRLDADRATLSGQSLGGYATWKNIVQFPDLFAASAPIIGPPSASGDWAGPPVPPQAPQGTVIYPLLTSLRNLPVIHWVGIEDELVPFTSSKRISDMLDQLGYRHSFWAFTGEHVTTGLELGSYDPMGDYVGHRTVDRNPPHVTYVYSAYMNQPAYGLTSDHAYWLSGLTLRDGRGAAPTGTIDAVSHGFGVGDASALPVVVQAGVYPTGLNTGVPAVPYYRTDLTWGHPPSAPSSDEVDITATNIRSVTINAPRARIDCGATIKVTSDGPVAVNVSGCSSPVKVVVTKAAPTSVAGAPNTARAVESAGLASALPLAALVAARARRRRLQPAPSVGRP